MSKDSILDMMGRYPDKIVKVDRASKAELWVYRDRPGEGQTGVFGFVGNEMRQCKVLEEHHHVNSERDYISFLSCYTYLRGSETGAAEASRASQSTTTHTST